MHPISGDGLSHYVYEDASYAFIVYIHTYYILIGGVSYTIYMPCTTSIIDPKCSAAMRCGFLTCLHFVQRTWLHAI